MIRVARRTGGSPEGFCDCGAQFIILQKPLPVRRVCPGCREVHDVEIIVPRPPHKPRKSRRPKRRR